MEQRKKIYIFREADKSPAIMEVCREQPLASGIPLLEAAVGPYARPRFHVYKSACQDVKGQIRSLGLNLYGPTRMTILRQEGLPPNGEAYPQEEFLRKAGRQNITSAINLRDG